MNIVIGLVPTFLYSIMCLIAGYFKTSPRRANVGISLSAGLATLILVPFVGIYTGVSVWFFGIAAGLMWAIAQYFQLRAYVAWGVSRTLPLSTALQLGINTAVGVFVYREWHNFPMLALGLASMLAIVGGVFLCNWRDKSALPADGVSGALADSRPVDPSAIEGVGNGAGNGAGVSVPDAKSMRLGLVSTFFCGTLFGIYPAMLRLANVDAAQSLAPMGVGLLLGTLVLYFLLRDIDPQRVFVPVTFILFSSGAIWAVGNAVMLYSVGVNGVAIGFALSQLGVVLTTLGGIYLLGEKRVSRELAAVWIGVLLVALGGIGLGLVKLL